MAEMIGSGSTITGSGIVVTKVLADLSGGKELDMTGVTTEYDANQGYIPAGTPIIKDGAAYKPLLEANLVADGPKAIGVLFQDIKASEPYASITIRGVVTEAKLPFVLDAACKAALNGISFI